MRAFFEERWFPRSLLWLVLALPFLLLSTGQSFP